MQQRAHGQWYQGAVLKRHRVYALQQSQRRARRNLIFTKRATVNCSAKPSTAKAKPISTNRLRTNQSRVFLCSITPTTQFTRHIVSVRCIHRVPRHAPSVHCQQPQSALRGSAHHQRNRKHSSRQRWGAAARCSLRMYKSRRTRLEAFAPRVWRRSWGM